MSTVKPPNKGHVGTRSFVLYREVSFIRRLKCTGIIGIGTSRFVLYREVFFIRSVLYRRFHCTVDLSLKNMSLNLIETLKAPEAIFPSARGNFLNEIYVQNCRRTLVH